ncbi:hypothetical protein K1T71_013908 [Dendrolimus kikuchii]|uniref:Uncharacterized protein n=1 Tax=Dendrolimus kikuchii TaxID=765133 RepID=A0ACC1CG31_9NEOP|nr:hypothetical protein K1T71_013908 [Dendrolimus kikuchii]
MGLLNSKEFRKVDEATSNSSLSNLRYVTTEKTKWKVFKKKDTIPVLYQPVKGCPCGNNGPCKQKVTPKGVTFSYFHRKKTFSTFGSRRIPSKKEKAYFNTNPKIIPKVKVGRPKKFSTWRMDKITYNSPYYRTPKNYN